MRRAITFTVIFFSVSSLFAQQPPPPPPDNTFTMTTYYPAPFGAYDTIQLVPKSASFTASSSCNIGTIYVDSNGKLQYCGGSGGTGTWGSMPSAWTQFGDNIYLTDTVNNPNLKVGIGTTSPQAQLDVNGTINVKGGNGLWQDAANYNLAVGYTGFPTTVSQSGGGYNGQYNTALGYQALNVNTTGWTNAAVGTSALTSNTTGKSNTAVGSWALKANTTGINNTAVGTIALMSNTTALNNTAVGFAALLLNTTANGNTALGYQALNQNTTGRHNMAVGAISLVANTTGAYNTAMGTYALQGNTTGTNNTVIGYEVGGAPAPNGTTMLTTGSNNILIGTSRAVTTPATDTNNFLNIGNTIYGDLSAGNVGIGTTSPIGRLNVVFSSSNFSPRFDNADPTIIASPGGGSATVLDLFNRDATNGNTAGIKFNSGSTVYSAIENVYKTHTPGLEDGILTFTTMGGGNRAERMRIDQNGNVGIGTTIPVSGKLHIVSSTGNDYEGGVAVERSGVASTGRFFVDNNNVLNITRGGGSTIAGRVIALDGAGNVGIGTTSPQATLDVNGVARLKRYSTQPFACDVSHDGVIALPGGDPRYPPLCVCDGPNSVWRASDGTNTCW